MKMASTQNPSAVPTEIPTDGVGPASPATNGHVSDHSATKGSSIERASTGRTPGGGSRESALPVQPMKNLSKWLVFNLVLPSLLLALAVGIVIYLGPVQSPSRPPIDDTRIGRLFALPAVDVVAVRSLKSTGQKLQLKTDGTVVPFREIVMATEVAGKIVEKSPKCESGKFVNKGDVLMVIDPTDYQLEVRRLQRQQQQQYEALGEVDQEMANTKKSIDLARTDIGLQERELKRRQALPDQFASQGEIDQARRSLLQAEQSLLTLQNQLELAKKNRIRLESSEQIAKLQLEAAENNLKRTTITAPMDGVIVSEQAELNTFVARGNPIVTMEDTSKVEVAASLRTDQLYWVLNQNRDDLVLNEPGGTRIRGYNLPPTPVSVRYQLSGREDLTYQWRGKLIGYDGIGLDEQTRTVPVRILVDHPQQFVVKRNGETIATHENASIAGPTTLVRGMFVNLSLELDPTMDLVVLPSESLKPGNRVWQFIPDPSVLDQTPAPKSIASSESTPEPDSAVESELDPQEEERLIAASTETFAAKGFDPKNWVPGQLRILQNVRPIDRFGDDDQPSVGRLSESEKQYWICEIPSQREPADAAGNTLPDQVDKRSGEADENSDDNSGAVIGDYGYVIVSPLGGLQADVLPVRAPTRSVSSTEMVTMTQSASLKGAR